jgi:uncharacterized alpha-E superfamily protein
MISRTAENCFWLARHFERAEMVTQAVKVNYNYSLETDINTTQLWFPLLVVLGERDRFTERFGKLNDYNIDQLLECLIWDEDNPSSAFSSIKAARENARIARDLISYEMFELVNRCWLWLQKPETRKLFAWDIDVFCMELQEYCLTWKGMYTSLILREEPYYFMQLGMYLERANLTARFLDIHHYHPFDVTSERESLAEALFWQRSLQRCMSFDAIVRRPYFGINRHQVTEFLLKEPSFPRTIFYCSQVTIEAMAQVCTGSDKRLGNKSTELLIQFYMKISEVDIEEALADSHHYLTSIVQDISDICAQIQEDFFTADMDLLNEMIENNQYIATRT